MWEFILQVYFLLNGWGFCWYRKAVSFLFKGTKHLFFLWLLIAESETMMSSYPLESILHFFFYLRFLSCPLVRLLHQILLFQMELKTVLLSLDGSILHPSLDIGITASVEHVRPIVFFISFFLLALFYRPGVNLFSWRQLIVLWLLLRRLFVLLSRLFTQAHTQILVKIFSLLVWIFDSFRI
jgi:hypothetical protein